MLSPVRKSQDYVCGILKCKGLGLTYMGIKCKKEVVSHEMLWVSFCTTKHHYLWQPFLYEKYKQYRMVFSAHSVPHARTHTCTHKYLCCSTPLYHIPLIHCGLTYVCFKWLHKLEGSACLILGLRPANDRRRYFVTTSLIGWAQT